MEVEKTETLQDWKLLDQLPSDQYTNLSQFDELIMAHLLQGYSPNQVAKIVGCSPNTIYSRIRQKNTFSNHYKRAVEEGNQIKIDMVLDELLRIATQGHSEATRVKSGETFLKAYSKIVDNIKIQPTTNDAEDVLKSLGI